MRFFKSFLLILVNLSVTSCFGYRSFKTYFADMKKKVELEYFGFLNDSSRISGKIKTFDISLYPFQEMKTVFEYEDKGYLFPGVIKNGEIKAFCYSKTDTYLQRTYYRSEFYLSWQVDHETFASEIERISSINTWCKTPKFSSDLFCMPAYIGIYNFYGEFEYVVIDELNLTLHYVYLFDSKKYDNLVFNKQLYPKKMLQTTDVDMSNEERDYLFSMYMKEYLSSI